MDKTTVVKTELVAVSSDFMYWQQQPVEARLAVLESIREEYHRWKYHDQQGFQRVYRIIKQP